MGRNRRLRTLAAGLVATLIVPASFGWAADDWRFTPPNAGQAQSAAHNAQSNNPFRIEKSAPHEMQRAEMQRVDPARRLPPTGVEPTRLPANPQARPIAGNSFAGNTNPGNPRMASGVRRVNDEQPIPATGGYQPPSPASGNDMLLPPASGAAPTPYAMQSAGGGIPLGAPPVGGAYAMPQVAPHSSTASSPAQTPLAATPSYSASSAPINNAPAGAASTARPADKSLDGPQQTTVTVEKEFPPEIVVGKQAAVSIKVRNTGNTAARDVVVRDLVPEGTNFVRAQPAAQTDARGELVWQLGTLEAGKTATLTVELMPQAEGELGSAASVAFRAEAGGRTIAVRPALTIAVVAAKQVLNGEDLTMTVKVTNPGSGAATNVVLEEHVPAAMSHPGGSELELDLGTLKPGESRELDLVLKSVHAGKVVNNLTARGDGNLRAEAKCDFEVLAPGLEVKLDGPSRRYLERPATYTLTIANPGTAPAKEVELVAHLPRGVKFMKADNEGTYDAATHSVFWSLEELPAQERGAVTLTTLPIEQGAHTMKIEGKTKAGLAHAQEQAIQIDGVAAILFEVADLADPIELNGETAYDVRIINQGSKAATNVQLTAFLPAELRFLAAEGATRYRQDAGGRIVFEPLQSLPAKSETVYRIRAKGEKAGDVRMKVQLVTDDVKTPITKEESTRVYADE